MKIAAWFGKYAARAIEIIDRLEATAPAVEFKTAFAAEYEARRNARLAAAAAAPKVDSAEH